MPPKAAAGRRAKTGDVIISRLREHAAQWIPDIDLHKHFILASYYLSLPNNIGGDVDPARRFYVYEPRKREITFKDVPVAKVAKEIESCIKRDVPAEHRTEIYHKVLTGTPGHKEIPEWDVPKPPGVHEKHLTPFSMPRDTMSNEELLDIFVSAIGLDDEDAKIISGQIICTGEISGGRLGRDHTLADVPTNYFRDRLMDYIDEQLEDGIKQRATRKAICFDLTDAEIEQYTRLIAEDRVKVEKEADRGCKPLSRQKRIELILESGKLAQTREQATEIILLADAVDDIGSTTDWKMPKPMGIYRDLQRGPKAVKGSVVKPNSAPLKKYESGLATDMEVDRDCDQVRAMIRAFCGSFWWSAESFLVALGPAVTRDEFTAFIKKRGTDADQLESAAYLLSWEFFNRRQQLGLLIKDPYPEGDLKKLKERVQVVRGTASASNNEALANEEGVLAEASSRRLNRKRPSDGADGGITKRVTRSAARALQN
ncbi:hypothetical protein B0T16DRAFT_446778 [Cercophora newfieldiana]|uniref:DUF7726 domain-containing protein n=1 Tax=Cercophora newfieldiana TaxID=92897 RepID=A0AA39Y9C4_9PEZI|nr:hypothetical protein B0T16DRAFT_446778 [Cercophora newfieldiana]